MNRYTTLFEFDGLKTPNGIAMSGTALMDGEELPKFDDLDFFCVINQCGQYITTDSLFDYEREILLETVVAKAKRIKTAY